MNAARLRDGVIKSGDAIEVVLRIVGGALFLAFIVTVIVQVLGRNLFRVLAAIWTAELATLLFVWSVFLGASIAVRHGRHYVLDVVPSNWPRARAATRWIGLAAIAFGAYIFLHYGWAFLDLASRRISNQLRISQYWFYLAIPVGGAAMLLFVAEHLLRALLPGDDKEDEARTDPNAAESGSSAANG